MNRFDGLEHEIGDIVYLKVNSEMVGIVTAIVIRESGHSFYCTWGAGDEKAHQP
jgi:hypothetical protein